MDSALPGCSSTNNAGQTVPCVLGARWKDGGLVGPTLSKALCLIESCHMHKLRMNSQAEVFSGLS